MKNRQNALILHNICGKIFPQILGANALATPVSYTYDVSFIFFHSLVKYLHIVYHRFLFFLFGFVYLVKPVQKSYPWET